MTAPIYHTWVILSNHHPSTASDENPRKIPFLVLFSSPAMNWDHGISWGSGVWVSVSDIGRVGHTGSGGVGPPELKKTPENECLAVWLGWWFDKITHVW